MAEKMAVKMPSPFITYIYWWCGWDLAEWLERLPVNAQSHNSPGLDPSILGHRRIWGAADEAVLNNVQKIPLFIDWCYCRSVLRIIYWTTSTPTTDWRWRPRYFSSSRWPLSSLSLCIYSGRVPVPVIFNFYPPYNWNLLSLFLSFHRWENLKSSRWRTELFLFFR